MALSHKDKKDKSKENDEVVMNENSSQENSKEPKKVTKDPSDDKGNTEENKSNENEVIDDQNREEQVQSTLNSIIGPNRPVGRSRGRGTRIYQQFSTTPNFRMPYGIIRSRGPPNVSVENPIRPPLETQRLPFRIPHFPMDSRPHLPPRFVQHPMRPGHMPPPYQGDIQTENIRFHSNQLHPDMSQSNVPISVANRESHMARGPPPPLRYIQNNQSPPNHQRPPVMRPIETGHSQDPPGLLFLKQQISLQLNNHAGNQSNLVVCRQNQPPPNIPQRILIDPNQQPHPVQITPQENTEHSLPERQVILDRNVTNKPDGPQRGILVNGTGQVFVPGALHPNQTLYEKRPVIPQGPQQQQQQQHYMPIQTQVATNQLQTNNNQTYIRVPGMQGENRPPYGTITNGNRPVGIHFLHQSQVNGGRPLFICDQQTLDHQRDHTGQIIVPVRSETLAYTVPSSNHSEHANHGPRMMHPGRPIQEIRGQVPPHRINMSNRGPYLSDVRPVVHNNQTVINTAYNDNSPPHVIIQRTLSEQQKPDQDQVYINAGYFQSDPLKSGHIQNTIQRGVPAQLVNGTTISPNQLHSVSGVQTNSNEDTINQQQHPQQKQDNPGNPSSVLTMQNSYQNQLHPAVNGLSNVETQNAKTTQCELQCSVCPRIAVFMCSGCKRKPYCSPDCQIEGWKTHSEECS